MSDSTPDGGTLGYNAALVLQVLSEGHGYGFEIMGVADLPSGTVYPLLRRLEASGLVRSRWEDEEKAHAEGRPARRYYELTGEGEAALAEARERIAARHAAVFGDLAAGEGSAGG